MLLEDDQWVWAYRPENTADKETIGKWVLHGKVRALRRTFEDISSLVEDGLIYRAKYTHKKHKDDPLYSWEPVLIVYADDATKEDTLALLHRLGLQPVEWKYDRETDEDWKPGGKLHEAALRERRLKDLVRIWEGKR